MQCKSPKIITKLEKNILNSRSIKKKDINTNTNYKLKTTIKLQII